MKLREAGWDMQQRLAQLASHPEDVDTLRAWLPALPGEPVEQPLQALAAPERPEDAAVDETLFPWSDDDRDDGHAPGWDGKTLDDVPAAPTPWWPCPCYPPALRASGLSLFPVSPARPAPGAYSGDRDR